MSSPKPAPSLEKAPTSPPSDSDDDQETFHDAATHFSPEDEATLLAESNATKAEANTLFAQRDYAQAISTYDRALSSCPNYLDYELAVLKCNIAACHLYLEHWKNTIDSATEALENLERLDPLPEQSRGDKQQQQQQEEKQNGTAKPTRSLGKETSSSDDTVVEIPPDEDEAAALHRLTNSDARLADIRRIRIKSLLRRARARHRLATWSSLTGAQEDYTLLQSLHTAATTTTKSSLHTQNIASQDLRTVRDALARLPAEIDKAKDKEMGEMLGNLKDLGNKILSPFGLSTDNFKMVKDEKTGGYSMNFEQGAK
ncbi:hypothetical protein EPUS_02033 [Endocarpon pusillum Z07020]|uniref:Uncharacterized protein n=1 Tax=Endocarpon pusillum (strain Z07020 / HMAS-L-300199) TaxID=1263415 RepID=U1GQU3_ENDPU|nr:uncharacterized protein EPUS_02033 [Endocarpon pusillum Z07020]ERF74346.1 hypothetical protein EPUS_02033 [Endocarpon pusillum Z07020]